MKSGDQTQPSILLYSAAQCRELDRLAIEDVGISGYTLMTRAGEACWVALQERWPAARSLVAYCGTGNNGGDGFVVARLALAAGWQVQVVQLGDAARIQGDALQAHTAFQAAGGRITAAAAAVPVAADLVLDAMLGTGIGRSVEGVWRQVIEAVNRSAVPVVAVDIPSGLQADTGAVLGAAVVAELTLTFIGRKPGLYTGSGPAHVGELLFTDLAVPNDIYQRVTAACVLQDRPSLGALAGPRVRTAHKGLHGHVLIVGGDHGMSGAVRLAGEAALRSGAGRVSLATRPEHAAVIAAGCPELMCHGVASGLDLKRLLTSTTVVLVGPGLGQSAWAQQLFSAVLETHRPLVVDADALTLLAAAPDRRENQVLTPHPGEAAKLLNQGTSDIQSDRFVAAAAIANNFGGTTVLKGAGTIIHTRGEQPVVCAAGNPGMATAGTGDVLAGVIAALIAQGMGCAQAAAAGVCLHACAGDRAAQAGERGLMARDVTAALRQVLNAAGDPPCS